MPVCLFRLYFSVSFKLFQRKLLTILSFFFLPVTVLSQTPDTESINTEDTAAIVAYIQKAALKSDKQPNDALIELNKALQWSRAIHFLKGEGLALAKIGRWYFGSDVDQAIANGLAAAEKLEKLKSLPDELADVHLLLAEAYDETGKSDSSAHYYYMLEQEVTKNPLLDADFAQVVYTKLAIFWININALFNAEKDPHQAAKRFVEKAREASLRVSDKKKGSVNMYFIDGAYKHSIKQYDSARFFYVRYLKEASQSISTARKISALSNIAFTYEGEGKLNEAIETLNQIKTITADTSQQRYLSFYRSFVDLQEGNVLRKQGQYQKAIDVLQEAIRAIKQSGNHLRSEVADAYKGLAECYEALGDYRNAIRWKNTYLVLHDSLIAKDKMTAVNLLETRTRIIEKDNELAKNKLSLAEINGRLKEKNFLIAVISLLTLSGVLIFALWRKKNRSKQKLQDREIANLQQGIKIERLVASIDAEERERTRIGRELHDGVGGLLSVARMNFELAKKRMPENGNHDFADGIRMLEEATVELRKSAYNLLPEELMTQGLANAVQAYCQKISGQNNTQINFQVIGNMPGSISKFDMPVYRIIQELIHNIIKHAYARHALVQINFHDSGGLSITVEDDGIGLPPGVPDQSSGMGLSNLKDRVKDIGGKLDIQSSPDSGTSIYMEFDALHENEQKL
jgi:signal transduction histidine kinase